MAFWRQFLGAPKMSTLSKVVNFNCEHNSPVNELAVYVYVQRVLYPRHAVHMHLLTIVRLFSDIADCQPPVANFLSQVYFSNSNKVKPNTANNVSHHLGYV